MAEELIMKTIDSEKGFVDRHQSVH